MVVSDSGWQLVAVSGSEWQWVAVSDRYSVTVSGSSELH